MRVRGLVQGVGFRPTVARLARALGLRGQVRNDGDGVLFHIEGPGADGFVAELMNRLPPLARVDEIDVQPVDARGLEGFEIVQSGRGATQTGVIPDAAMCSACREETYSPAARRYRYPFTNCTHCGPRFSIIEGIPYDRPQTTMRAFEMCPACEAEYDNEADRRYHAQPIACHTCGPRVWLERSDGRSLDTSGLDDLDAVTTLLKHGEIVAIRGLGGYHLACDATNEAAVARLRERKLRESKPLALMARDREVLERYADVTDIEWRELTSPSAPIVLLRAREHRKAFAPFGSNAPGENPGERSPLALADGIAPGTDLLGFMLPYTPLHALMMKRMDVPVVMTSGNRSAEPQCITVDDARVRLREVADYFLHHDREIAQRVDDSVVRVTGKGATVLRHARGYAPQSVPARHRNHTGIAMGGDLKAALALARRNDLVLSQHLGDLDEPSTRDEWERTVDLYLRLFDVRPDFVAVDAHPGYVSRRLGLELASRLEVPAVDVQHHHAHVAACLADHGREEEVVGIVLDGVGWGEDGTAWGGELLVADLESYSRVASLAPRALLGGDRAAREPWRNAYAQLVEGLGWELLEAYRELPPVADLLERPRVTLDSMLAAADTPRSSSAGRLFDAVAATLDLHRERIDHEAQAAMALEGLAQQSRDTSAYPIAIAYESPVILDPTPMWRALLKDVGEGVPVADIARRFHLGLAEGFAGLAERAARATGLATVALSGGCFANALLTTELSRRLEACGLEVLTHRRVPPGDGGLAVGQAAIARKRRERSM